VPVSAVSTVLEPVVVLLYTPLKLLEVEEVVVPAVVVMVCVSLPSA